MVMSVLFFHFESDLCRVSILVSLQAEREETTDLDKGEKGTQ